MIKEAGLEQSNMPDSEHGLPILISTTARKFFREQFPDHAKTRNWVVNQYLAGMFSNGNIVTYFKPKKGSEDEAGEIRESGGGRFIGIVASDHVRVLAVKGGLGGALPALSPQAGSTGSGEASQGETVTSTQPQTEPQQPAPSSPEQDLGQTLQSAV